jgi:hypothetical protein
MKSNPAFCSSYHQLYSDDIDNNLVNYEQDMRTADHKILQNLGMQAHSESCRLASQLNLVSSSPSLVIPSLVHKKLRAAEHPPPGPPKQAPVLTTPLFSGSQHAYANWNGSRRRVASQFKPEMTTTVNKSSTTKERQLHRYHWERRNTITATTSAMTSTRIPEIVGLKTQILGADENSVKQIEHRRRASTANVGTTTRSYGKRQFQEHDRQGKVETIEEEHNQHQQSNYALPRNFMGEDRELSSTRSPQCRLAGTAITIAGHNMAISMPPPSSRTLNTIKSLNKRQPSSHQPLSPIRGAAEFTPHSLQRTHGTQSQSFQSSVVDNICKHVHYRNFDKTDENSNHDHHNNSEAKISRWPILPLPQTKWVQTMQQPLGSAKSKSNAPCRSSVSGHHRSLVLSGDTLPLAHAQVMQRGEEDDDRLIRAKRMGQLIAYNEQRKGTALGSQEGVFLVNSDEGQMMKPYLGLGSDAGQLGDDNGSWRSVREPLKRSGLRESGIFVDKDAENGNDNNYSLDKEKVVGDSVSFPSLKNKRKSKRKERYEYESRLLLCNTSSFVVLILSPRSQKPSRRRIGLVGSSHSPMHSTTRIHSSNTPQQIRMVLVQRRTGGSLSVQPITASDERSIFSNTCALQARRRRAFTTSERNILDGTAHAG